MSSKISTSHSQRSDKYSPNLCYLLVDFFYQSNQPGHFLCPSNHPFILLLYCSLSSYITLSLICVVCDAWCTARYGVRREREKKRMRDTLADTLAFLERPEVGWVGGRGVGGRKGRREEGSEVRNVGEVEIQRGWRDRRRRRGWEGWSAEVGGLGGRRGGRGLCRLPNDVRRMARAA